MQQHIKHSDLPPRSDPNYQTMWREKRRSNKLKADRYEGSPCRNCGGTTKYNSTKTCVNCLLRRRLTYDMPKQYGITLEEYNQMLQAQNNTCAICIKPIDMPCVDHDHITGKVRGLLCRSCNTALGFFQDDPTLCLKAAKYLQLFG